MAPDPALAKNDIDLVFEDEHIIVVNKPPGLLCVPGLSDPDNLFDRVKIHFPNARVVHRLDMATSGLVIFALSHPSQKRLGQMFESKTIRKRYRAVLEGRIKSDITEIVAPLICDWEKRPKQKVSWLEGKYAHTICKIVSRGASCSLVELNPVTGRTHQLRLHMQYIGHPIVGDRLYHPNFCEEDVAEGNQRLLLHAEQLTFHHPITNKKIQLRCDLAFNLD